MVDAIKESTGVDFWREMSFEEAVALAKEKHVLEKHSTLKWGISSMPSSKNMWKKTLTQPTFVYGHPQLYPVG